LISRFQHPQHLGHRLYHPLIQFFGDLPVFFQRGQLELLELGKLLEQKLLEQLVLKLKLLEFTLMEFEHLIKVGSPFDN
jgi:hypothetical protein